MIKKKNNKAFTLLEFLVVITIIAIIVSWVIWSYNMIIKETKEETVINSLVLLNSFIEIDYATRWEYINYDNEEWKKLQKSYYNKKNIFNKSDDIANNFDIYYSKNSNNEFCIWFEAKTDKIKDRAKDDWWFLDDYYEVCNSWHTTIDISDNSNRFLIQNDFFD